MSDDQGRLRTWERHWSEVVPPNYLRSGSEMAHPSRDMIADVVAEIGDTVLECGCASAIDYPRYAERGVHYTGVDMSPQFLQHAREVHPDITVCEGNLIELPLESDAFDTVFCRAVFEHMLPEEWPLGLREMWRVARKAIIVALFKRDNPAAHEVSHDRMHVQNHALSYTRLEDEICKLQPAPVPPGPAPWQYLENEPYGAFADSPDETKNKRVYGVYVVRKRL